VRWGIYPDLSVDPFEMKKQMDASLHGHDVIWTMKFIKYNYKSAAEPCLNLDLLSFIA
jgi:hypothetical protein